MAHILYSSRQAENITEMDMQSILATSTRHNFARGITGMLLADNDCSLQLLEGDGVAVRKTYDRIRLDTRHEGVTLLMEDELSDRLFPGWSMGYLRTCGIQNFATVDRQLESRKQDCRGALAYRFLSLFRRAMILPMQSRASLLRARNKKESA